MAKDVNELSFIGAPLFLPGIIKGLGTKIDELFRDLFMFRKPHFILRIKFEHASNGDLGIFFRLLHICCGALVPLALKTKTKL